jgi:hypothetical protein
MCPHLQTDHSALLKLMRAVRKIEGISKVFIASGVRTDLALCDERYIRELIEHHTGGHLSTAPEHTCTTVLELMNKPGIEQYDQFCTMFANVSKKLGKEQYIVPYLMAGFPGATVAKTIETAVYLKRNGIRSEQVQEFVPGPFELATCMYYTGLNPITGQPVYVPVKLRERRQQKALLMYDDPNSYHDVKSALKECGREDLIGTGADCLIAPYPPKSLSMRRSSRVKRLQTRNEAGKKQKEDRREMFAEKMRQAEEERRQKLREEREAKRRQTADGGRQKRSGGRKPAGKSRDWSGSPKGTGDGAQRNPRSEGKKFGGPKSGGRKPTGKSRDWSGSPKGDGDGTKRNPRNEGKKFGGPKNGGRKPPGKTPNAKRTTRNR